MKRNPLIEFFLQADTAQKKDHVSGEIKITHPVREYYRYASLNKIKRGSEFIPEYIAVGVVDESIKAQHPDDYAVFSKYVAENDSKLYEKAKSQLGEPLKVNYFGVENGSVEEKEA